MLDYSPYLLKIEKAILTGGLTAPDILQMLLDVDGVGSGLDADMLQGRVPGIEGGNLVYLRNSGGTNLNNAQLGVKTDNALGGLYWSSTSGGGFDYVINNPTYYQAYRLATRNSGGGMWCSLKGYAMVQEQDKDEFGVIDWVLQKKETYQDYNIRLPSGAIALFNLETDSNTGWLNFIPQHVMGKTPPMQVVVSGKWL